MKLSTGGREPFGVVVYLGSTSELGGALHVYIGPLSIEINVPRLWRWRFRWEAGWRGAYR